MLIKFTLVFYMINVKKCVFLFLENLVKFISHLM